MKIELTDADMKRLLALRENGHSMIQARRIIVKDNLQTQLQNATEIVELKQIIGLILEEFL